MSYTGTSAMAIMPLPLPPGAEARALLHHILEHGDVVGETRRAGPSSSWRSTTGRSIGSQRSTPMPRRMVRQSCSNSRGRKWWSAGRH